MLLMLKIRSIFHWKQVVLLLMNDLLKKYTDYMRLENCRAEYLLANGQILAAIYKEENFAHLLGLHKLIDIQVIQFWQDKSNKKVKSGTRPTAAKEFRKRISPL